MITIAQLKSAAEVLNVSAIAKLTGIPKGTLDGKVRYDRELSVTESVKITEALLLKGIVLQLPEKTAGE